jgi:hypothetical protein
MNIENYQEDVINKLQIHKDHSAVTSHLADKYKDNGLLMLQGYKDDFDCVSILTDRVIKPTFKITTDHMIAIIPIKRWCDLFRFNKLQLKGDEEVDNSFINKIQLVLGDKVIIDDLAKLNIYFPVLLSGAEAEIRVFFDKTSMTRENLDNIMLNLEHFNVVLTCDQVYLNSALRLELYRQDFELIEGVRYDSSHHGFSFDVFGAFNNITA